MDIITQNNLKNTIKRENYIKTYKNVFDLLVYNVKNEIRVSKVKGKTFKVKNFIGVKHYNFIEINSKNRTNFIVLDFDKILNKTFRKVYRTIKEFKRFLDTYLDDYNIIVQTDKGYQVYILFNNSFFYNNKNDKKILEHLKNSFIEKIPGIDPISTKRKYGMFRNPLQHNHYVNSLEGVNLSIFYEYFNFNGTGLNKTNEIYYTYLTKNIEQKNNIKILNIDDYKEISKEVYFNKKYELIKEGNRNIIFWIIGMYQIKKYVKNEFVMYNNLYSYLVQLNSKIRDPIETEEIEHITSNCVRYTMNNKNFIILHNKKDRKQINKDYYNKHRGEKMTRKENMVKLNKQKADNTKRKVLSVITGMFANEYKKKNGEWNISKISKDIGVSRNSVYKYLQQL